MMRLRRTHWRRWLIILAVIGLLVGLRSVRTRHTMTVDPHQLVRVERVVDGDTLILSGGERVRLLGVNTPELARDGRPAEPGAEPAREFLATEVMDREISLGFAQESHDKYGRRLAYVYRAGILVNEEIIRAGWSRAETGFPYHDSMKTRFRRAEREAREQQRGIWSDAAIRADRSSVAEPLQDE